MKNNYTPCSQCRTGAARIITSAGFKCWKCYHSEQKMFKTEDWRDTNLAKYATDNDLTQREGETENNLINRCKQYLVDNGFVFD